MVSVAEYLYNYGNVLLKFLTEAYETKSLRKSNTYNIVCLSFDTNTGNFAGVKGPAYTVL